MSALSRALKGDPRYVEGDDLALLIRSANGYLFPGRWSGHASVETTQRYIAMPDDQLRAAVEATRLAA